MKAPVVLVAAALTAAILLTASLLIATGTRGATAFDDNPTGRIMLMRPVAR
jgi:hypothetical protein